MSVHDWDWAGRTLTGFDADGVEWTVETVTGWNDAPNMRAAREARSQQDGEWDSTPHRAAREVVLQGKAHAPSHAALEAAGRRHAASALKGELTGATEGSTLTGSGYLLDGPRFEHVFAKMGLWQLAVVLPDPILYGPLAFASTTLASTAGGTGRVWPRVWPRDWGVPPGVTPGALGLPNGGTAAYWPTLRVQGPVPNPVVTLAETGDWVRYGGTLSASQWLDIDCANRRVLLNGQVSVRHLVTSSGNWLAVPPGGGSLTWTADDANPAALLSATYPESAWT